MAELTTAPHLEDSELLHLVDGDAGNFELDRWTKHVLACADCGERLRVLRIRSERVSARLAEVQLPADFRLPELPRPARRPASRRWATGTAGGAGWLRAAAVVLLVVAPFVLVRPLRAWVADRVAAGWAVLAGPTAPANEIATSGEMAGSARVLFPTDDEELSITFASTQAAGALVITLGDVAEGSLLIVDGAGETPLVHEGGLLIGNAPGSTASYELTLPASVVRMRVQIGDAAPTVVDLAGDGSARIELSAAAP